MPAPATVDEFLELVRKSGVVEETRLKSYLQEKNALSDTPTEVNKYAGLMVRDGLLTYFQAEQFLQGKWKRFTIGKYKVLERLGSGGMGQVFLCEHKLMRRKVAVKVLPTAKAEDPSSLERFYREARAVAALDHPNIVRAYDIDQDDNLHFLVMEFVDGASFQDIVKKHGKMDVTRACHYMYWSAIGLQHAHEAGLIHRDIKPGNILIDRTGTVKILDMGLARFFNDDEDLLTKKYDENVLGTADYLAPEQAIDSHTVDGRADIYSLGATFYFLLVGHQPFLEGTVAQKLLWHQNRNPKSIKEVRADVPDAVVAIIQKMMAKNRDDRYQNPAELAEALSPFVQTPIDPPPEKEMPQFSAAAQASGGGPATTATPVRTTTATRAITPIPRVNPSQPGSGSGKPKSQPQPSFSHTSDTQRVTPAPSSSQPAPIIEMPDTSDPVWESFSDESNTPTRNDTQKQPPAESKSKSKANKPKPRSSKRLSDEPPPKGKKSKFPLVPVAIALGLAVAVSVAVWYFVFRSTKGNDTGGANSAEPLRLTVSKHGGGQCTTIKEAIDKATAGSHIALMDEEWEETVNMSSNPPKGLVIEAGEGKHVTWKADKSTTTHVLLISRAEELAVHGIRFQGDGRTNTAIRVTGRCPGLKLEDLEFSDFTKSCVTLVDCVGQEKRPVLLRGLRCRTSTSGDAGVDLAVTVAKSGAGSQPNKNESVLIADCRFEGQFKAAIRIDGTVKDFEITQNRFWDCTDAIYFMESKADYSYQIRILSNTFYAMKKGLHFQKAGEMFQPNVVNTKRFQIEIKQNYFFGVAEGILVSDDPVPAMPPPVIQGFENVRSNNSPDGKPPSICLPPPNVSDVALPTDPKDEKKFLRYDKSNPLFKAANGKPVGVPPID